jgi:hypothetical protein
VAKVNKPVNVCKDAKTGEHATPVMMASKIERENSRPRRDDVI